MKFSAQARSYACRLFTCGCILFSLILSSCGNDGAKKNGGDSTGIQLTPDTPAAGISYTAAPLKNLLDTVAHAVLGSKFNRIELEETDLTQNFSRGLEKDYRRFISLDAIRNKHGRGIFTRTTLRATRFADTLSLKKDLDDWLGSFKTHTAKLSLGQESGYVKANPVLCAVLKTDIFILTSPCIYEGDEWNKITDAFRNFFKARSAQYFFRIDCSGDGGGRLLYDLK